MSGMAHVFAYGSNLCIQRLQARTPSARVVAVASLAGHALRWHKKSADGSGKCNVVATGSDADLVWGVVYELTPADKLMLDGFEGLGTHYFEKPVAVGTRDGELRSAIAYVANPRLVDDTLRPFLWYKSFVTTGARQHGLPSDYRAMLEAVEARDDANAERNARESAVLETALRALG
jgi:gamma-glutamylcyclotransferase (GGCT)/AIG2-like uncharacterized protein YtfP